MNRTDPNLNQKLACAVLQLMDIPHEHAKLMTTEQILSLVHCDHYPVAVSVAVPIGWTPEQYNHPSNLRMVVVSVNLEKGRKVETPQAAKSKRIIEEHKFVVRKRLTLDDTAAVEVSQNKPRRRWPYRPIKSGPFPKRAKV